jgi:DNA-binding CsgD family transcriptional regulator
MAAQSRPLEALGDTIDGLYLVDHRQRIVRWNVGATRLLGHTSSDVLQRKCYDVVPACFRDGRPLCGPACPVHSSVARGELPRAVECTVRAKDGRSVRLHISLIVIPYQPRPLVAHVLHSVREDGEAAGDGHASRQRPEFRFTQRERQVLHLVAEGLSNVRIAERLDVSRLTIRNHVQHILAKCGAHSRAEAVSFAFLTGLL